MNVSRNSALVGFARRRPISLQSERLVEHSSLASCGDFPLVIEARFSGLSLSAWVTGRRAELEGLATRHGAVLLRGFTVAGLADFEECVEKMCGSALEYRFRASPRTEVGHHVYTATDYPADQIIFPHNEHAYSPACPRYLIFYCEIPSTEGGETPIGNNREITRRIDPAVRARFLRRGVLYVRNYGAGFGLPWPIVFQTDDRAEVERYCNLFGIEWKWKSNDRLCTRQAGPALIRHPRTNEEIWFNHATFFHVTTLPTAVKDTLLAEFDEDDLPTQTYYGDGGSIEAEVLEHLRSVYRGALCSFEWRTSDVLLVDNILAVHGRAQFSGIRRVLVSMAQVFQPSDWAVLPGAVA
jgi:alpha-ketoglutarate-dependent taurine dioxygenase